MAGVKPLKLKQEKVRPSRERAFFNPVARVLVDHGIVHLDHIYDYLVPEELSTAAVVGALVEIEFGHQLTQGIILERSQLAQSAGELKELNKVLSSEIFILPEQCESILELSTGYGCSPWDLISNTIPPFSKTGERLFRSHSGISSEVKPIASDLPDGLSKVLLDNKHLVCAVELPSAKPYWEVVASIVHLRAKVSKVLLLVPNERELLLTERAISTKGIASVALNANEGKSERYAKYLLSRSDEIQVIIGTRSSSLLPLPPRSTILVLDDVDESYYERQAPTWNSRDLVSYREKGHSVLYLSSTVSLEIASRVSKKTLPLFRFPQLSNFHISTAQTGKEGSYFSVITKGLAKGSVLISMGNPGYVTSFSCQNCRNIALCDCGGKLYLPGKGRPAQCATCSKNFLEWSCTWCGNSRPRSLSSGVLRRAEEFGRAFPRNTILTSSGTDPLPLLPDGRHIALSTPGVEPRGRYSAIIFLDLEGRLVRTTLRASEEVRFGISRSLTMLEPDGFLYFDLQPSDPILQSLLRSNPYLAAEREIEEREAVNLPPHFSAVLISSEDLTSIERVLAERPEISVVGPFLRNRRKTLLLKIPQNRKSELIALLSQVNRVQSLRKEPLITFQVDPYSLN